MPNYEELHQEAQTRLLELEGGGKPWIRVGSAICCEAAGADETLKAIHAELETRKIDANVNIVGCLGLCYAAPLVDLQKPGGSRVFYGNVTPDMAAELVESCVAGDDLRPDWALAYTGRVTLDGIPRLDDLPVWNKQVRIALRNCGHIDPLDIYQYIAQGGYAALDKAVNRMTPEEVLKEVQDSGLRGRGGAAFPTGTKWGFLARSPGPVKYILCNCEEGDPGAYNDKGILESDPHSLIEGTILAGYATGSSNGVVFIRHGHEGPIHRTERAIEQAYELGLLGDNILGSDFSFHVEVSLTGDSYVAGEETALMESIEGNRAMPRARPPFPAASGVWRLPSNINNIKSLAYVSEIVSRGGEWFAGIGTEGSKGTAILCLSGHIKRPGMYEIPMGLTIRDVLEEVGGGVSPGERIKVLQTGGPLGGVLGDEAFDVRIDFDEMSRASAILGSGGIIVGNETVDVVDLIRVLIAFNQYESCGKCFPCRLGNTHMLEILERIYEHAARPADLQLMERIGNNMRMGSLCGHGQLGYNPVSSALKYFGEDFAAHMEEGRSPTGQSMTPVFTPQRTRSRWTSAQPLELRF